MKSTAKPQAGDNVTEDNRASQALQSFFDEIEEAANRTNTVARLASFEVVNLPDPVEVGIIFVTDETGGAVMAFSDGTNFRRCTDRAVVS